MKNQSPLISVARDDLSIVTGAILGRWEHFYVSGGGRECIECYFCREEQALDQDVQTHTKDCPVLVAMSIQPHPQKGTK